VLRLPVEVQLPLAGSYSSALRVTLAPADPPATRTSPLGSKVAVCRKRPVLRLPVTVHVPPAMFDGGVGRGCGVGRDLGVGMGLAVGVTIGVGVGVALGVGVGVPPWSITR